MPSTDSTTGHCYCGQIQFEMDGDPGHVSVCHCDNCRRATGGQAVAWTTFPQAHFRYVKGKPTGYKSETNATWSFCPNCGTTLTYQGASRPNEIDVVLVNLDEPTQYAPSENSFVEEKLSWVNLV